MHKYICYFCDKEFKEIAYYSIHMEKNLCTFISNTSSSDVEIQSYLYKLNKKRNSAASITLKYPPPPQPSHKSI
jgi:hypothetical protein